ncbi:unnamed protein product [Durusdinium trenchii]|uniref:Uncharacterized protein n=2 Tax=Durusdinium trenchii TaxID=1381693 RepID=A0ABP0T0A7_9DINO
MAPSAGFRLKVLLRNLQSPSAGERLDAVRTLNTGKEGSSAAFLADALCRDGDWQVRRTAAKALGALGAPASNVLVQALGDANPFVREAAAEAIGHVSSGSGPIQLAALEAVLRHDAMPFVRSAAGRAIGSLAATGQCGQSYAALEDALLDDAWQVRWQAARALAFSSEDQVASVASCLKDESWLVRREACASLGVLSSVKGRSALEKALRSDSDSRVREEAAKSLAAISKSAKLLGKSTDATGFPTDALAAALKDEEVRVRTAAIVALGSQPVAARQHAGYLVEQLLTGDRDVRAAVFTVFQEATSHAGARLVAAAFDAGKRHQVRQEAEEIMAWSRAIARHVLRLAQDLRAASREAQLTAERHLSLLGPAAGVCLVNEVVKTKGADFGQRMATIRGLISCFSASERARLPPDLACAALSEWIYEPSLEHLPVPGLELVKLQTPEEHHGINLQWAVLRDDLGSCFVVFRGSETVLDWTENSYVSLRRVSVPAWHGVLLLHSGFWSTAEAESQCLLHAVRQAAAGSPFETVILCGGSKGGANALAAAIQWSVTQAPIEENVLPCQELQVVTFGAPNIVGRGSGKAETARALQGLRLALESHAPRSRAWSFTQDPVPALMSSRSRQVISYYHQGSRYAMGALRRIMPEAYKKVNKYLKEAVRVTATFQPVLTEAWLDPPPGLAGGPFQAAVHPQRNYTEALCRRLLHF